MNLARGDRIELEGLTYETREWVRDRMPDQVQAGWKEESLVFDETPLPSEAASDALRGSIGGLSAVTVDVDRAGFAANAAVDTSGIATDGPVTLTLRSAGGDTVIELP